MKMTVKQRTKKSTYRVWILSYLFILLIPLVFGVSIYMFAMRMVANQAEMAQRETLRSALEQTDRTLQQVQESVVAVLNTTLVDSLGEHKGQFGVTQYENIAYVQDSLNKIKTNSSYIDEIYLYFPEKDYLVSSYNYIDVDQSLFMKENGISQEEFDELAKTPHYKAMYVFQNA